MFTVILLIAVLILINGLFVSSEMALVTARKTRLELEAKDGDERAGEVLKIQEDPGEFLSTVQIAITLIGTAASALGGADLAIYITPFIAQHEMLEPYAHIISLGLVIALIAYFTLVLGELVPKRLALQNPEGTAKRFIRPLKLFAKITMIPMRVLNISSELVIRIMGAKEDDTPSTSPAEIELLVEQGVKEGVLAPLEEKLIHGVFDYTERDVLDVMTPRTLIVAFEVETPIEQVIEKVRQSGFSRFPIYEETIDHICGYIHIKDLLIRGQNCNLREITREMLFMTSNTTLPNAFDMLTRNKTNMAIVMDEYGGTDGVLALDDVVEEIVGQLEDEYSEFALDSNIDDDGICLFDGRMPIVEACDILGIKIETKGMFNTVAGFVQTKLGYLPDINDELEYDGYTFKVTEKKHMRIKKIEVLKK